jgi:hypothetical protein
MAQVNFTFNISLDESEFIQVEDLIYTTKETLARQEPRVQIICQNCLNILKDFEGRITKAVVDEWLLLSRALDQTCSYQNKWDDKMILEELIAGREHPVSWYVKNCQVHVLN